jgi:hypothetical protein
MPDEDALPEELADYHIYVKEIEAIEKESRAARRVFEQRIQKHKIIQMTCEEDLQKMELDYSTQQSKLLNKKSAAEKKKTDELTRLRSELDKNLLELKHDIAKRRLHRKMQFQFRQEDMGQQPLFVESDEYGPTDSFVGGTHSVEGEPKPFTSTENIDQHVVDQYTTMTSSIFMSVVAETIERKVMVGMAVVAVVVVVVVVVVAVVVVIKLSRKCLVRRNLWTVMVTVLCAQKEMICLSL